LELLAGNDSERWREWGPLKDNHHWQYEFKEKIEENAEEEVQRGDFGDFEVDDSASEPEEYEINETDTNREGDEFFINCGTVIARLNLAGQIRIVAASFCPSNLRISTLLRVGQTQNM